MTGIMMASSNPRAGGPLSMGGHQGQVLQANRCRADSGSTYSSSDTSNRSKTSSRRRSHRPRGCRGGSSRKKRRGGKVPKEIGGATIVEGKVNVHVNVNHNSLETSKTLLLQQPGEVRRQKPTVSFADENHGSDENAGRTSTHQPFHSNNYLPLTSNAAVLGDNINKKDALPPLKSKMSATSNSYLPPLQESMKSFLAAPKESSSSHHQQSLLTTDHQMKTTNAIGPSFSQTQILPPLDHPEPAVDPSQKLQGPNIYALQSNKHSTNHVNNTHRDTTSKNSMGNSATNSNSYPSYNDFHGSSHQLYGYDNHSNNYSQYGANYINDQFTNDTFANDNSGGSSINYESEFTRFHTESRLDLFHSSSSSNHRHYLKHRGNKTPGASYRIERIEKQRQMMPEGGSLFVTSPKSFLMGWKSDETPRM